MAKRLAPPEPKRPLLSRIFWGFYKVLVVLSVLVIGSYAALSFLVAPPDFGEAPSHTKASPAETLADSSQPEADLPTGPVRKEQHYNILLLGCDDGHGNTDTIMLLSYDVPNEKISLVSIPRDTLIQRDSGVPKINAAYAYGGIELLQQEIQETLGVPIDCYVRINLKAFVRIVDTLGGLDFYVPQDMYHDDEAGFIINLQKGQQHLTGNQVLQLVRYRGYNNADIGRTEMQQQVLSALARKALSWDSFTKIQSFAEIFMENVDTDLTLSNLLFFAQSAVALELDEALTTYTLEGRGDGIIGSYQWCYELDPQLTLDAVNTLLNPYTEDLTLDDLEILKADHYYFSN